MPQLTTLCLTLMLFLVGCTTVPHTGRRAVHLMSNDKLAASAAAGFSQLKQETAISTDPTYNAMLQRVGERIAEVAGPDMPGETNWEFVVFDDPNQMNAFAMPGGKVAVYTGLFKAATTEDELATVVGHEVAHVVAGHSNERASQQILAGVGAATLAIGTGVSDMDDTDRALLLAAYGAGAQVGVLLPFSRTHELEADELGLYYVAKAGYNPMAAVDFWERMSAMGGSAPPEWLSTHPADDTRINRIKIKLAEVMPIYRETIAAQQEQ
ncbi:M48 family metallopeptidase [Coraliomargarita akajimensis]|uniref:Peptidase M48 Ste24p n=1 Tax=Coraliomargarita akajimensis (strain DSM 45221 / IAM 15411 / JCM 23193 / KCTC 12865 / 04OKA010-24) TaxID=583355 RepID=D5ERD2_CORAD|nr:M48 family metallopeptidase [Coraliomargarita akajimensis]ADE55976.1 peptidase M48 Ste24p [Coraliomargarita akajimensis DSM 45221]